MVSSVVAEKPWVALVLLGAVAVSREAATDIIDAAIFAVETVSGVVAVLTRICEVGLYIRVRAVGVDLVAP
jgi:hypothetical protein